MFGVGTAVVGAVAMNVVGFPEAEVAEGIAYVGVGGFEGATAMKALDALAGEPMVSRIILSFSGAGVGVTPGLMLGYGVTPPAPDQPASDESANCP